MSSDVNEVLQTFLKCEWFVGGCVVVGLLEWVWGNNSSSKIVFGLFFVEANTHMMISEGRIWPVRFDSVLESL